MKKYRYKYKKSYRTKKKKSIFRTRFFWFFVLFLFIFGTVFYFVVFSSFFQIKKIEIYGNQKTTTEEVKNIVGEQINKKIVFFISRNIFLIDFKKIEQIILEKFPQIARATLERKLPDAIILNIEERISIGVWCKPCTFLEPDTEGSESTESNTEKVQCKDGDCFNLDREGVIFEEGIEEGAGLIIKSGKEIIFGEKIIEKEYLGSILEVQGGLKGNLKIDIKEIFIPDEEKKLIVRTFKNWEIYFNPAEDISEQIFNLGLVLKEKIPPETRENLEYIDLRFGSRVYFKYKDRSAPTP